MVRLQEEISKLPEGTSLLKSTEVAQESARQASLAKISNVANRPAAEALVAKAQEAYKAINPTMVRSNSTLKNIANSKAFRAAEKRAADISQDTNAVARANKERVIPFKKTVNVIDKNGKQVKATEYSAQGLQNIKQVLDEMSENPTLRTQLGISGTESVAIGSVRSSLVKWMNRNVPGWEKARKDYRAAKMVTNRMDIGKLLEEKLTGPRGEERIAQFLQATRDAPKTIKTATGKSRFKDLKEVLTPKEMAIVNNLEKELRRDAMVTKMGKEVNIPGQANVALGDTSSLPNLLWRPSMVAHWILNAAKKDISPEIGRISAGILNDPNMTLQVLNQLKKSPGTIKKLTGLLEQQQQLGPILYQAGLLDNRTEDMR